ncbi:MAG: hypothetical protein EOM59_09290 [Clostridia bacterium]|nr:hypothetical protein [Clostridia bacterium]
MELSKIVLARMLDNRIIPLLLISCKNETYGGLKIKNYDTLRSYEDELKSPLRFIERNKLQKKITNIKKWSVIIGQPDGLRYKSYVFISKPIEVPTSNIVREIASLDRNLMKTVLEKYEKYNQNQLLHKELHTLKQEILIAQLNNENYVEKEERLNQILLKLGYDVEQRGGSPRKENWYREIPSKGPWKIYLGGR